MCLLSITLKIISGKIFIDVGKSYSAGIILNNELAIKELNIGNEIFVEYDYDGVHSRIYFLKINADSILMISFEG